MNVQLLATLFTTRGDTSKKPDHNNTGDLSFMPTLAKLLSAGEPSTEHVEIALPELVSGLTEEESSMQSTVSLSLLEEDSNQSKAAEEENGLSAPIREDSQASLGQVFTPVDVQIQPSEHNLSQEAGPQQVVVKQMANAKAGESKRSSNSSSEEGISAEGTGDITQTHLEDPKIRVRVGEQPTTAQTTGNTLQDDQLLSVFQLSQDTMGEKQLTGDSSELPKEHQSEMNEQSDLTPMKTGLREKTSAPTQASETPLVAESEGDNPLLLAKQGKSTDSAQPNGGKQAKTDTTHPVSNGPSNSTSQEYPLAQELAAKPSNGPSLPKELQEAKPTPPPEQAVPGQHREARLDSELVSEVTNPVAVETTPALTKELSLTNGLSNLTEESWETATKTDSLSGNQLLPKETVPQPVASQIQAHYRKPFISDGQQDTQQLTSALSDEAPLKAHMPLELIQEGMVTKQKLLSPGVQESPREIEGESESRLPFAAKPEQPNKAILKPTVSPLEPEIAPDPKTGNIPKEVQIEQPAASIGGRDKQPETQEHFAPLENNQASRDSRDTKPRAAFVEQTEEENPKQQKLVTENTTEGRKVHAKIEQSAPAKKASVSTPEPIVHREDSILARIEQPTQQVKTPEAATRPMGASQQVASEDVYAQVVKHMESYVLTREYGEVRIQLHPETLGDVRVRVIVEHGVVSAELTAENQVVKEIIAANLSQLRSTLQEMGMNVASVNVNVDHKGSNNSRDRAEDRLRALQSKGNKKANGLGAKGYLGDVNQTSWQTKNKLTQIDYRV